jgi:hypothetical protein
VTSNEGEKQEESRPTWRGAFETAADRLEEPYPAEIAFCAPLSPTELEALVNAMNAIDPNGSCRFFVHCTRHCAKRLRGYALEEAEE